MLFAKTGTVVPPPELNVNDIAQAVAVPLLSMSFLVWFIVLVSFRRHEVRHVLAALATGSVLGIVLGSVYAVSLWSTQNAEVGRPIEEMAVECLVRKPLLAASGCLGMVACWISLLIFGKRAIKTDHR